MSGEKDEKRRIKDQQRRDAALKDSIDSICRGLHRIFPEKSVAYFKRHLQQGRRKKSRHWLIYPNRISYIQYKEAKRLPIFRQSIYSGGFHAQAYNQRRRFLMDAFRKMNLECFEPYGAFYVFPCIKEFGMTSEEFATRFLQEEKVAVVPGTAFGECGEGFLRISYAYSLESLKLALGRLEKFINKLRQAK